MFGQFFGKSSFFKNSLLFSEFEKKRNKIDSILNETEAGVAPNSLHDLGR